MVQKQSSSWKVTDEDSLFVEAHSILSDLAEMKFAMSSSPQEICAYKSVPKSKREKTTNAKAAIALASWLLKKVISS